jgi:hypothetical protein
MLITLSRISFAPINLKGIPTMKTEYPGIDWLIKGEPRPVQLEALARSYRGEVWRTTKNQKLLQRPLYRLWSGQKPAPGWGHFMEMRLGKSAALFNEFRMFQRDYGIKRLLIAAPNRYKFGWGTEAEIFGVTGVHVLESNNRKALPKTWPEVLVVNYEAFRSDENMQYLEGFVRPGTMIAADESIWIKNRTTYAFKNLLALRQNAGPVRALTGKPVVQGPHDLWSQLRFLGFLNGVNYYAFRATYCKMGGFQGKQVVGYREDTVEELQQGLNKMAFIAYRKDWGTHMDPDYEERKIEMLPEQKKHYKEMEEDFITWLHSGQAVTAEQVITKHAKLQQISSGFLIDEEKKVHSIVAPDRLPKLQALLEALENEVTGKALVICFFKYSMDLLLDKLKDYSPALIGSGDLMKKLGRDVESEKRRFNMDPKCRVLIGQIQAVKYGHMLMGSKDKPCLDTFYYENTYSLDDRSQSEQRNQGEGQLAGIHVVDFYSSPVERNVVRALQRKENVAKAVMQHYNFR